MSGGTASQSFELLHRSIQKWVWKQGWPSLRDFQERAIRPLLAADRDVVIAAATAGGKTEAAFLPICSRLADQSEAVGLSVLYISPLKALINDQFRRLEELFDCIELPTSRWHGDVGQAEKRKVRDGPKGALLITPESLESVFINHAGRAPAMFGELSYVVVDELHAFIGTERGRHLQSLLHRVERLTERKVPRVALSATLGDMETAAGYLRPDSDYPREIIELPGMSPGVRLQVRGYLKDKVDQEDETATPRDVEEIADHLFGVLRGKSNLAFTNRRADTEVFADLLRRRSEALGVPNEFHPHHGSLSRALRQDVEAALVEGRRPTTAVCTSTLELGIDIGSVSSVAQIGVPPSVAALRQRLGRSGRRGEPATLRIYITESSLRSDSHPEDMIRADLVETIAMVRLLLDRWYEPPRVGQLHLSTLVHQTLSVIAEKGGDRANQTFQMLCQEGPFSGLSKGEFAELLRALGASDLISQTHDGLLVLGLEGERIVNRYDFYAAFQTPEEYRLVYDGRALGSLPILYPVAAGSFLIFAGRRWEVDSVDDQRKLIDLHPSPGGKPPLFGGSGASIHDHVREEMLLVYNSDESPAFLDSRAIDLLEEGRDNFRSLGLQDTEVLAAGEETTLFPWKGDRVVNTLVRLFEYYGAKASRNGVSITIQANEAAVREIAKSVVGSPEIDAVALALGVANKETNKFDPYLSEELLARDYAVREFDVPGAVGVLKGYLV